MEMPALSRIVTMFPKKAAKLSSMALALEFMYEKISAFTFSRWFETTTSGTKPPAGIFD